MLREKLSELLCLDVHGMLIILKALSARRGWLAKSQNDLKSKGVKFNPRFQATVVVMGTMLDDITCGRIPIEEGRWKYHLTDGIGAEKTCGALLMQNCCSSSCRSNLSNPCGPGSTNWPNWSQRVCLDLIANLNNAYFFSKKYGHGQSSF